MNSHQPFVAAGTPETQDAQVVTKDRATSGPGEAANDKMVRSRLGVISSLFLALKAKHPPTAAHCFRVAIGLSKWAAWRRMEPYRQDILEVAGLLHDLGKIGVPDELLQKPNTLNTKERTLMEAQRKLADELLSSSGANESLIHTIQSARYSFVEAQEKGIVDELSCMLSIVDAYDSMTTKQVFRRALTREQALEELLSNSGVQFQGDLVEDFAILVSQPRQELELQLAQRWLNDLAGELPPGFSAESAATQPAAPTAAPEAGYQTVFHYRLLDFVHDAIVYLDPNGQIINWNRGAEVLAGRMGSTVNHHRWSTKLMGLVNIDRSEIGEDDCPLRKLYETNTTVKEQFLLISETGREHVVDLQAIPVFGPEKEHCGSILHFKDASETVNLEKKVQNLHEIATIDPLTKVSNRAELNRHLPLFVEKQIEEGTAGSCIICDIDFFKKINDTYGHQAGDDALVTFAGLLKETAREYDVVARYGGEEFVILCPGCDGDIAEARAEDMRRLVQSTPVPALDGRNMTSSFGVTEIQGGDTGETLLARADRALLTAKENGRNRVIRLGAGGTPVADSGTQNLITAGPQKSSWMSWFGGTDEKSVIACKQYIASVPKELAIQRLEGFIADHRADVQKCNQGHIVLKIDPNPSSLRKGERPTAMVLDITCTQVNYRIGKVGQTNYQNRTMFTVKVTPHRARDRRLESLEGQAAQVLSSFASYIVAQEIDDDMRKNIIEPR